MSGNFINLTAINDIFKKPVKNTRSINTDNDNVYLESNYAVEEGSDLDDSR